MNISPAGIAFIKSREGFSPHVVPDGAKRQIGYGHDLLPGESFQHGITPEHALALLMSDLEPIEATLDSTVKVPLGQNQYDALCSFIYNVGCGAFRKSTLLADINANDFDSASREFERWVHSDGKVLPALVSRRKAEQTLFNRKDSL